MLFLYLLRKELFDVNGFVFYDYLEGLFVKFNFDEINRKTLLLFENERFGVFRDRVRLTAPFRNILISNGIDQDSSLRINVDLAVVEFEAKDEVYFVQFRHRVKLILGDFTIEHYSSLVQIGQNQNLSSLELLLVFDYESKTVVLICLKR